MSALFRAAVLGTALCLAQRAIASPEAVNRRVVLADADPELRRAVEASLRPWRIDVVVDPAAPAGPTEAHARADGRAARFVVWREGDELVVYDRERDELERRASNAGPLDPIGAAAAALTVKTMMRLPPPDPAVVVTPPPPQIAVTVPPEEARPQLRLQLGFGAGYSQGLDPMIAPHYAIAVLARPWGDLGWRAGVIGDFGGSATVDRAGFRGTFAPWSVLAVASWEYDAGSWQVGPYLAVGLERSALDGTELATERHEAATLGAVRAGATWWLSLDRWRIGAMVGVEGNTGTVTYTKTGTMAQIFEIPAFGASGSLIVGVDFDL